MTTNYQALIREHDALARLTAQVRAAVAEPVIDVPAVRAAINLFVAALTAHMRHEEGEVYPKLIHGRDIAAATAAAQVAREFVGVSIEWAHYHARWTDESIAADWSEFVVATDTILDRIEAHIRCENEMLYPLALAGAHIHLRA